MAARDPAVGAEAQPDQEIAAERLHQGDALAQARPGGQRGRDRPGGQRCEPRPDQRDARSHFADAHPDPRIHVAFGKDRHVQGDLVIGRVGDRVAGIERASRTAADVAARPPAGDEVGSHDAGVAGAILQRRRIVVQPHDLGKTRLDHVEHDGDGGRAVAGEILRDAARHDAVHHQPVPERDVARRQNPLAQDAAMRMQDGERRVVADRPDVAQVIGDALELRHHAAHDRGAPRHVDVEGGLDGARKRKARCDRGVAGYARDDPLRAREVGSRQQAVDALVDVAEPLLQPRHRLAVGGEAGVSGSMMPACTGPTGIRAGPRRARGDS